MEVLSFIVRQFDFGGHDKRNPINSKPLVAFRRVERRKISNISPLTDPTFRRIDTNVNEIVANVENASLPRLLGELVFSLQMRIV